MFSTYRWLVFAHFNVHLAADILGLLLTLRLVDGDADLLLLLLALGHHGGELHLHHHGPAAELAGARHLHLAAAPAGHRDTVPLDDGAAGEAGLEAALCLWCGGAVLVWLGGGQPPHTGHSNLQADTQGHRGAHQPRHRRAAPAIRSTS